MFLTRCESSATQPLLLLDPAALGELGLRAPVQPGVIDRHSGVSGDTGHEPLG